jgi:hypothetical protein
VRYRGLSIDAISDGLVNTYIDVKTARADASRALFLVASELDTTALLGGISERIRIATTALLNSAVDAGFDDIETTSFILLAALTGTVRTVFERGPTPAMLGALRAQLTLMCRAYLEKTARPVGGVVTGGMVPAGGFEASVPHRPKATTRTNTCPR